ncbi:MAG: HAD family phosphatase [Phycisphaerales bacterium]
MYAPGMDALIFDFDGTIVDTEPLHEAALRRALEPYGVPVREGMSIGLSDEDAIARACEEAGCDPLSVHDVARVFASKVEAFTASMEVERTIVYPGAVELFLLAAESMPVAICTAAMRDEVLPIIRWLGIADAMSALVTADEVERKKPAPDAYALACARVGVDPVRAVALEDSPRGVRSAVDAGLVVCALLHTTPGEDLAHAHELIGSTSGLDVDTLRGIHAKHAGARS